MSGEKTIQNAEKAHNSRENSLFDLESENSQEDSETAPKPPLNAILLSEDPIKATKKKPGRKPKAQNAKKTKTKVASSVPEEIQIKLKNARKYFAEIESLFTNESADENNRFLVDQKFRIKADEKAAQSLGEKVLPLYKDIIAFYFKDKRKADLIEEGISIVFEFQHNHFIVDSIYNNYVNDIKRAMSFCKKNSEIMLKLEKLEASMAYEYAIIFDRRVKVDIQEYYKYYSGNEIGGDDEKKSIYNKVDYLNNLIASDKKNILNIEAALNLSKKTGSPGHEILQQILVENYENLADHEVDKFELLPEPNTLENLNQNIAFLTEIKKHYIQTKNTSDTLIQLSIIKTIYHLVKYDESPLANKTTEPQYIEKIQDILNRIDDLKISYLDLLLSGDSEKIELAFEVVQYVLECCEKGFSISLEENKQSFQLLGRNILELLSVIMSKMDDKAPKRKKLQEYVETYTEIFEEKQKDDNNGESKKSKSKSKRPAHTYFGGSKKPLRRKKPLKKQPVQEELQQESQQESQEQEVVQIPPVIIKREKVVIDLVGDDEVTLPAKASSSSSTTTTTATTNPDSRHVQQLSSQAPSNKPSTISRIGMKLVSSARILDADINERAELKTVSDSLAKFEKDLADLLDNPSLSNFRQDIINLTNLSLDFSKKVIILKCAGNSTTLYKDFLREIRNYVITIYDVAKRLINAPQQSAQATRPIIPAAHPFNNNQFFLPPPQFLQQTVGPYMPMTPTPAYNPSSPLAIQTPPSASTQPTSTTTPTQTSAVHIHLSHSNPSNPFYGQRYEGYSGSQIQQIWENNPATAQMKNVPDGSNTPNSGTQASWNKSSQPAYNTGNNGQQGQGVKRSGQFPNNSPAKRPSLGNGNTSSLSQGFGQFYPPQPQVTGSFPNSYNNPQPRNYTQQNTANVPQNNQAGRQFNPNQGNGSTY
jgi:hypothetical protein